MDIGTKRNLISVAKWAGFWGVWATIDIVFDMSIFETILDKPAYNCVIVWGALAIWLGEFEARYYHHKNQDDKYNEHFLFTLIRSCTLIPIWSLTDWKSALCIAAIFPFFHDGSYYTKRNELNHTIYTKKWFAQSTTSTALTTKIFTPIVRTTLAIIGLAALIIINQI